MSRKKTLISIQTNSENLLIKNSRNVFVLGNPFGFFLAGKYMSKNSEIFIVDNNDNLVRAGFRNYQNDLLVIKSYLQMRNLKYRIIRRSDLTDLLRKYNNSNIYIEINFFTKKLGFSTSNNYISVNWGADMYLSKGSVVKNISNIRKIEAIIKWRRGLNRINCNLWLIPKLSSTVKKLGKSYTVSVEKIAVKKQSKFFFKSYLSSMIFKQIKNKNAKLIVIGIENGLTESMTNQIKAKILMVNRKKNHSYIIKPHPNTKFGPVELRELEHYIGYESCNNKTKNKIELIKSVPLEVILFEFKNSIYIGPITGGINYFADSRINFVSFGDTKRDNLQKMQYSEFLKRK